MSEKQQEQGEEQSLAPRRSIRLLGVSIAAVLVAILTALLVFLWSAMHALPPVRISYQGSTNDPAVPFAWGVFRLENDLKEPVVTPGGVFERWDGQHWVQGVGTYYANFGGEREFAKHTTTNVQTVLPRKPGRYRLALRYLAKSRLTPQFFLSRRNRVLQYLIRKRILPVTTSSGAPIFPGYYAMEQGKDVVAYSEAIDVPAIIEPERKILK